MNALLNRRRLTRKNGFVRQKMLAVNELCVGGHNVPFPQVKDVAWYNVLGKRRLLTTVPDNAGCGSGNLP
jgi:hypothetical protein